MHRAQGVPIAIGAVMRKHYTMACALAGELPLGVSKLARCNEVVLVFQFSAAFCDARLHGCSLAHRLADT